MSKEHSESNILDKIISFESGVLDNKGILELFAELIKSGMAWSLQGSYGRLANSLLEKGLINKEGIVNWELYQDLSCK